MSVVAVQRLLILSPKKGHTGGAIDRYQKEILFTFTH